MPSFVWLNVWYCTRCMNRLAVGWCSTTDQQQFFCRCLLHVQEKKWAIAICNSFAVGCNYCSLLFLHMIQKRSYGDMLLMKRWPLQFAIIFCRWLQCFGLRSLLTFCLHKINNIVFVEWIHPLLQQSMSIVTSGFRNTLYGVAARDHWPELKLPVWLLLMDVEPLTNIVSPRTDTAALIVYFCCMIFDVVVGILDETNIAMYLGR